MTKQHDIDKKSTAINIIDNFLADNPNPTEDQWKLLIEQYKEYAGDIVDTALLYSTMNHLEDSDVETPLDMTVFDATISNAMDLVLTTTSPLYGDIEKKVAAIRGPAVRKVATDIGLEIAPFLLNSIICGSIKVPHKILQRLADIFDTRTTVVKAYFSSKFEKQAIPVFKAENGKPEVAVTQKGWEETVRSLNLPLDKTEYLLSLDLDD